MDRHLLKALAAIGALGLLAIAAGRLATSGEEPSVTVEAPASDEGEGEPLGGEGCGSVDDVRAAATDVEDLEVDIQLCAVTVIRTTQHGYFVQDRPGGTAIQVFDGSQLAVSEGDRVSMRVVEVTQYEGNQEIIALEELSVDATGLPLEPFVRDLTGGVAPDEALESERVRIRQARVKTLDGRRATLDYGEAEGVRLWLHPTGVELLCEGATVDLSGVVTENEGTHRLSTFDDADLVAVDVSGCSLTGAPATPENLIVEELLTLPPGGADGDANCDGRSAAAEDIFVELVNAGDAPLLLGGVRLSTGEGADYEFPAAALLEAGAAAIVFGGGAASCRWPPGAHPFVSGGLAFGERGGALRVLGADGRELARVQYPVPAMTGGSSLQRVPAADRRGASTYRPHATVAVDSRPYSAGRRVDGSGFVSP